MTALTEVIGNFSEAVKASSEVLKIGGRIYPSTEKNVTLEAVLEGGAIVRGETQISRSRRRIETIRLQPRRCRPHPDTLKAIAEADLITLGPGSLFTSVIPNLLVEGISQAIRRSRAVKAYLREPDVAAGRDLAFHRVGSYSGDREACGRQAAGLRDREHAADPGIAEEALRASAGAAGGE